MNKPKQRLLTTAAPYLQAGEVAELPSIAMVGSLHVKRSALMAAATLAASGGVMAMYMVPVKQYLLLTDRRLIFFAMNQATGRPASKVNGELPRAALTASPARRGLLLTTVDVAIAGETDGLRLRFPLPARADAYAMAQALAARGVIAGGV